MKGQIGFAPNRYRETEKLKKTFLYLDGIKIGSIRSESG